MSPAKLSRANQGLGASGPAADTVATGTQGTESDPVEYVRALLASQIRAYRLSRGLTIAALAKQVGITAAMASQIERGVTNPSMSMLVRLAGALQISVAQLFEVTTPDGTVVRTMDRRAIAYPDLGICDEVISSDLTGQLQVLESRIEPGRTSGHDLSAHGAETECVLVLEGSIDILVGGTRYSLRAGDTLTFQGDLPHGFETHGDDGARVIWVMTPATF